MDGNVPQVSDATLQLWFHYETIAMHFNELIIQYRLQLMGGTGAIGAIAFALIQGKDMSPSEMRLYRMLLTTLMLVLVSAAGYLDLAYYSKLLEGAVAALLDLEKSIPQIKMSTQIAEHVGEKGLRAACYWYAALIGPLTVLCLWSQYKFWKFKD